jgi:hypothetical protein
MSWNYRVTTRLYNHKYLHEPETLYEIREVYYDENGDIVNFAEQPDIIGHSLQEVKDTLRRMVECCKKPIIEYNTGEEAK